MISWTWVVFSSIVSLVILLGSTERLRRFQLRRGQGASLSKWLIVSGIIGFSIEQLLENSHLLWIRDASAGFAVSCLLLVSASGVADRISPRSTLVRLALAGLCLIFIGTSILTTSHDISALFYGAAAMASILVGLFMVLTAGITVLLVLIRRAAHSSS